MNEAIEQVINPARLAKLRSMGLLDTPREKVFDDLGELAAKLLSTPMALVSLVDESRQFFKSCRGLPEPWLSWRESPMSHSFCKHVVGTGKPLVIGDARRDPRVRDNAAVRDLNVIAYLGIPLLLSGGHVLGTFCVLDSKPRAWSQSDVHTMEVLTKCVVTELELRSEIKLKEEAVVQLSQLNADLRAFSYSVSHDLKAPLRQVVTFGELLQREAGGRLERRSAEYLETIINSAKQMRKVIEGLMMLAQMGNTELHLQTVDLTGLAREVLEGLRSSDPQRQVEARVEENLSVQADPQLLRQVLQNLLGNAWKFTAGKEPALIELLSQESGGERVYIVRDNGVGFPSEMARRVFMAFEKLHGSEFAGSGIGLAIVKRIIERHHGDVCAEATPGEGAAFYFTLPGGEETRRGN